jgi:hypothetical protein
MIKAPIILGVNLFLALFFVPGLGIWPPAMAVTSYERKGFFSAGRFSRKMFKTKKPIAL